MRFAAPPAALTLAPPLSKLAIEKFYTPKSKDDKNGKHGKRRKDGQDGQDGQNSEEI